MKPHEIEAELRKTLGDGRLSRSEKRALRELVATIEPSAVDSLRALAFRIARETLAEADGAAARGQSLLDWLEEVVKTLVPEPTEAAPSSAAFFSPGDEPWRKIVGLLSAVRTRCDICVFTITDDRIAEAIAACHGRGARVRLISDDDKAFDLGSDVERLKAAGVPVRVDRSQHHMHHKFALFDGELLLTGSYNWTRSAAAHNHENVIVTADRRLAEAFADVFDALWASLA